MHNLTLTGQSGGVAWTSVVTYCGILGAANNVYPTRITDSVERRACMNSYEYLR